MFHTQYPAGAPSSTFGCDGQFLCPPCVGEPGSLEQAVCVRRVLWVPVFLRSLNSCGAEFIPLCHPFVPKVADNLPFNQIKAPVRVLQH